MKKFVVDASVCLKWVFEEEDSEKARIIQKDFQDNKILLVVPNLWEYEIVSALSSGLRRKKITFSQAKLFLKTLMQAKPEIVTISNLLDECLENTKKYDLSAYDSAYVTLAKEDKMVFISADNKLVSKINDTKIAITLSAWPST